MSRITPGILACWLALACGGTEESPPPPPPPPPAYSYESIAGTWDGTVTEDRTRHEYTMSITMSSSAIKGNPAGQIRYNITEVGFAADCTGSLVAEVAPTGDLYVLREVIAGPCVPNGEVRLMHNRSDGTIGFAWFSQSGQRCCTATLTRRP